jgi:hypothetical protein
MYSRSKYALSLIVLVAFAIRVSGLMSSADNDDGSLSADHWEYVEFILPQNNIIPTPPHTENIFVGYTPNPKLLFVTTSKPVLHYIETRAHSPPVGVLL